MRSQDPIRYGLMLSNFSLVSLYCILDDTHLFTYQAAWAKFNTLSQNLSFKPNYNQLS